MLYLKLTRSIWFIRLEYGSTITVFYELYFGVLGKDNVKVCALKITAHLGLGIVRILNVGTHKINRSTK